MSDTLENNRRIAENTMFLYVRMLISLAVQLYTSRVILNALGISDYGIYNVVGGMVTMFAFMSNTMSTAAQRFMSYAIGKNDEDDLRKTFVVSTIILWGIAFIVFLLVESVGLWFLFNKLNIPDGRMFAAFCIFHFSVITLFVTIISIPYNAEIIAHEKMSIFAGFSLIDIFLKLGAALLLTILPESIDRLITYGCSLMIISILSRTLYTIYCKKYFVECSNNHYNFDKDKGISILSFFGWNTIGSLAYVTKEQGVNILINIFFDTIVNAARGVTNQVIGAIQGFVSNFQLAMNPQITKYCAKRDFNNLFKLVQRGAKFSIFLYFFIALPIFLDLDYILNLWLVEVPEHTFSFIRLTLVLMMIEALSSPIIICLLAVGKVKWYQIIVGGLQIMNLPISYIALKLGYQPEVTIKVAIVISFLSLLIRLLLLNKYISFPIVDFLSKVLLRATFVISVAFTCSYYIYVAIPFVAFTRFIMTVISSWTVASILILFIGMSKSERGMTVNMLKKFVNKIAIKI